MNQSSSFNVCTLGHDQVDEFLRFEDAYSLEGALVFAEVRQVFSLGIPIPTTPLRVPDGVAEQPILVSLLCYVLKICHHWCLFSAHVTHVVALFAGLLPKKWETRVILSYPPSELPPLCSIEFVTKSVRRGIRAPVLVQTFYEVQGAADGSSRWYVNRLAGKKATHGIFDGYERVPQRNDLC